MKLNVVWSAKHVNTFLQLGAVTADNATPDDAMIAELSKTIDGFLGEAMHVRCFDHRLNLMAKVPSSHRSRAF